MRLRTGGEGVRSPHTELFGKNRETGALMLRTKINKQMAVINAFSPLIRQGKGPARLTGPVNSGAQGSVLLFSSQSGARLQKSR